MKNCSTTSSWVKDQALFYWVENDPRSVYAMLRNRGDHRSLVYRCYYWIQVNIARTQSLEVIDDRFNSLLASTHTQNSAATLRTQFLLNAVSNFSCDGVSVVSVIKRKLISSR